MPARAAELVTPGTTGGAGGAGFGAGGGAGLVGAAGVGVADFDADAVGVLAAVAELETAAPGAELAAAALEAGALDAGGADPSVAEAIAAPTDETGAEDGPDAVFLGE